MAKAKPIDVELVRSLLEYAPELNGSCLRWKVDRTNGRTTVNAKAGSMAGCLNAGGYYRVGVEGVQHLAHRLVWAIVHGVDPIVQIDHVQGVEAGNHIENLRLAPRGQMDNNQNGKRRNNTSGYTGVSKVGKKWKALIRANNVQHHIGYFYTPEEAYSAYLKAKADLHTFNPVPRDNMTEPTLKHIAYRGRRYRVSNDKVYQWRTMDDSYMMAWLPFRGSPELERTIRQLAETKNG